MKLINKISYMLRAGLKAGKIFDILNSPEFENNRILGELCRNTHSIEKGLSIKTPRMGFGVAKINTCFRLIERLESNHGDINSEPVLMFCDALSAYLEYHNLKNYSCADIDKIKHEHSLLCKKIKPHEHKCGGYIPVQKKEYTDEEYSCFKRLFYDRHSVRKFDGSPVDETRLHNAIELAMRCPSACNRQCYRIHILDKSMFGKINSMEGIGGFFNELDKFILITASLSVYRTNEEMQYIVTSSVFAGYLTLSLQANGIGCCFIQRDCLPSDKWDQLRNDLNIPKDEQLVCSLGIGNLCEEYNVPESHRFDYQTITKCYK